MVATGRRPEQLADLARSYGAHVRTTALDVTDPAAARAAVQVAADEFGSLAVVVNNAGYGISAAIEEMTTDDFRALIEADLFGVVNVTKAALPLLHRQRSGLIIQFSSIGGRVGGTPGLSAYQTAKLALEGFSEVLNDEVKPLGIKVTILEPGGFHTDWGGSSLRTAPVGPDYEPTVGQMNRFIESTVATWPGDPKRAAQIIVGIAGLDDPPLRLLHGAEAVDSAANSSRPAPQKPNGGPPSAGPLTSAPIPSPSPRHHRWAEEADHARDASRPVSRHCAPHHARTG
jgi:NAD(P)-dependent dehydrogenase (short-subunit alcohol dehydrogenase family)